MTVIAAAVRAGDQHLLLTGHLVDRNQPVLIGEGERAELRTVNGVAEHRVTLDRPLDLSHPCGTAVRPADR